MFKAKKKKNKGFSKIDYFGIGVVILAILASIFYLIYYNFISVFF